MCLPLNPTIPEDFFQSTAPEAVLTIKKIFRLVVRKVKFKNPELNNCLFKSVQVKTFIFVNKIKLKLYEKYVDFNKLINFELNVKTLYLVNECRYITKTNNILNCNIWTSLLPNNDKKLKVNIFGKKVKPKSGVWIKWIQFVNVIIDALVCI